MSENELDEKSIKILKAQKELPTVTIIFPILAFLVMYVCTIYSAESGSVIHIFGRTLPLINLPGVFSAISSLCLVFMVLNYKKFGFIVAVLALVFQLPKLIVWIFLFHSPSAIPGVFINLFTILMMVIIRLYQLRELRERHRMQDLFEQTATALVNAIDTKDKYTHGHSARVASYSRKLAELNHKSAGECDEIYYAALLHDVGKIGVPSNIINKDGKLSNEEYEIIKEHPAKGAQILETIREYPYLKIGAKYHHERYDGKGYPDGLKGEEIPELARIVAVADAYDAMTSIRSYRDPISQDKVREEMLKGAGVQFDPVYARLMLHLIDVDTEYEMKERAEATEAEEVTDYTIGEHRDLVIPGILISGSMSTIRLSVTSDDEAAGIAPEPSMVLFDALDGIVHTEEKEVVDRAYFEYGEVWFDGHTKTEGARKIQSEINVSESTQVERNGEYLIEAVRIKDHALIRVIGKKQTAEMIIALPDSTRYLYIGLTGKHCAIHDLDVARSEEECKEDYIPRIADEISYINVPAGDIPNIQIDGFRSGATDGIRIKNGLRISFHTKSLPTARLVWHCPFIDIFCSDDGKVNGAGYRDLALMRFDGECWEYDQNCVVKMDVVKNPVFEDWDVWKDANRKGYDTHILFKYENNTLTMITENAGVEVKNSVTMNGIYRPIYVAISGDQVAITDIHIH